MKLLSFNTRYGESIRGCRRFAACFALSIWLLGAGHLEAQPAPPPAHGTDASVKPKIRQLADAPIDWREQLTRNYGAHTKILEFFDYQCPYCASNIPALEDALRDNSGQVQLILKHNPLSIHPDSFMAHQAALAAGEQGKFWAMHDLLFANQQKLKLADLLEYARRIGLDLPRFRERLRTGYYKPVVEQDMALAAALGVVGTPTFFINGQRLMGAQTAEHLHSAIAGKADPGGAEGAVIPVSDLDLSHSPFRGTPDAPVTMIEFSDLQCPFCASVVPTLQELMKDYPTQVKWVFKNFPLDFHVDSALAHRAALAAGEQGKFWEMHDLVFAGQDRIKKDDLLEKARTLKLDVKQFAADLESSKIGRQIESDQREGNALRVDGTPTFYINGREYAGAMPLDKFKSIIESELAGGSVHPALHDPREGEAAPGVVSGPADAPLTLVWFSDLQSDLTLKATLIVRQLMTMHPGKIRLIFKNRPLESHPGSISLHEAAMAANAQDKFWPMHDLIIANASHISSQDLVSYAQRIGLDVPLFRSALETHKYRPSIEQDVEEARRRAVQGAPVFFLNAKRIDGLRPQKVFEDLVEAELAPGAQATSR